MDSVDVILRQSLTVTHSKITDEFKSVKLNKIESNDFRQKYNDFRPKSNDESQSNDNEVEIIRTSQDTQQSFEFEPFKSEVHDGNLDHINSKSYLAPQIFQSQLLSQDIRNEKLHKRYRYDDEYLHRSSRCTNKDAKYDDEKYRRKSKRSYSSDDNYRSDKKRSSKYSRSRHRSRSRDRDRSRDSFSRSRLRRKSSKKKHIKKSRHPSEIDTLFKDFKEISDELSNIEREKFCKSKSEISDYYAFHKSLSLTGLSESAIEELTDSKNILTKSIGQK